ncbi:MAG: hypothetical protein JNJ54_36445 [Myxococcaceae bacterium]|nr:hypothetical protein [Myxococcaceae bacterium]
MRSTRLALIITTGWAIVATALWLRSAQQLSAPPDVASAPSRASSTSPPPRGDEPEAEPSLARAGDDGGEVHRVVTPTAEPPAARHPRPDPDASPVGCHCPALPASVALTPHEKKSLERCEAGRRWDCTSLVMNQRSNPVLAARGAAQGCNLGETSACAMYGHFLVRGIGVDVDEAKGFEVLRKACADDARECFHLVLDGADRFPDEAYRAAQRGCAVRRDLQCKQAGDLVREKKVLGTPAEAAAWYESGCALGDERSCNRLLDMTEKGELGAVDARTVLERRRRACATGTLTACDALK